MYVHGGILVVRQCNGMLARMGPLDIATRAAALIVEDGMPYGTAKRQAAQDLGYSSRVHLPDQATLLAAVREHIAVFCPEEQARTLHALRELALMWMQRLAAFRPLLVGAVWNGTATEHSDIYIELYGDDPKEAQILLLNQKVRFDEASTTNAKGQEVPVLIVPTDCPALGLKVMVQLTLLDWDDMRHLPKADAKGESLRGNAQALEAKMRAGVGLDDAQTPAGFL
jgi:hypothetical protein